MADQPDATDGRVPRRDDCVLRYVLERQAERHPERVFIRRPDGSAIAYRDWRSAVERTAAGLAALGVRQGDFVNVWMPSGIEMLRLWFAINWLGAVYVPINTAYRGNVLAHVIANGGAEVMIASADLIDRLADIDRAARRRSTCLESSASRSTSWMGIPRGFPPSPDRSSRGTSSRSSTRQARPADPKAC